MRDLRLLRDPLWEAIHSIDAMNAVMFELQARLKRGLSPSEAMAVWQRARDAMDRALLQLAPQQVLLSPAERACSSLQEFLRAVLQGWELSPSQRDRIELQLRKAERERLGAEAAAA